MRITLTIHFDSRGLRVQEYYEEESIVELYQSVLERLIIATADEDDEDLSLLPPAGLAVHEERLRVWPPWPWPPWDPEDPDKPGKDEPINRTKEAPKLARQIIELEKKIANASLDLDVLFQDPLATYNPVSIFNLTDALPELAWNTYFAAFTPRNYPERAILTSTTYPASLSSILQETDRDTLEVYANPQDEDAQPLESPGPEAAERERAPFPEPTRERGEKGEKTVWLGFHPPREDGIPNGMRPRKAKSKKAMYRAFGGADGI